MGADGPGRSRCRTDRVAASASCGPPPGDDRNVPGGNQPLSAALAAVADPGAAAVGAACRLRSERDDRLALGAPEVGASGCTGPARAGGIRGCCLARLQAGAAGFPPGNAEYAGARARMDAPTPGAWQQDSGGGLHGAPGWAPIRDVEPVHSV